MTVTRTMWMWFEGISRPTPGPLLSLLLAGVLASSSGARAQTADDAGRAFDHGIAELKLGKYETACAALEQSHRIEPNLGALIALADCLERWGKLHTASRRYEEFLAAVSAATPDESAQRAPQRAYARSALARLAPQIPVLRLTLPGSRTSEVEIFLDDRALAPSAPANDDVTAARTADGEDAGGAEQRAIERSLDREVALDPGHHVIETHAVGHESWRLELDIEVGQRRALELALGPARQAPPPAVAPEPVPAVTAEPATPALPRPGPSEPASSHWRALGWGLGGLGVAGIGVGAVAGVMVLQTCPSLNCESRPERGKNLALASDVGFGVGLAALTASAILLLSTDAPPPRTDNARWQPRGAIDARGAWLGMSHVF